MLFAFCPLMPSATCVRHVCLRLLSHPPACLQDLDERLALDMPATAAQVPQHIRMLTIHGTADSVIPVTDGRNFAAVLPGHRLVEVEGADHNFRTGEEHVQQLIDAVVAFFDAAAEGRCSD